MQRKIALAPASLVFFAVPPFLLSKEAKRTWKRELSSPPPLRIWNRENFPKKQDYQKVVKAAEVVVVLYSRTSINFL